MDPCKTEQCPSYKPRSEAQYVLEINHKIDMLKRLWSLFTQNKEWVLSLLFVSSIIHSILLYGLFGINILEFYSLTDIFVNFAEVFVPFLIMIPLGVLLYLFPDGESKCSSSIGLAIKIVLFVFAAIILSLIFHNYFGVPFLIYFIALIGLIYMRHIYALGHHKLYILHYNLLFLLVLIFDIFHLLMVIYIHQEILTQNGLIIIPIRRFSLAEHLSF